MIGRSVSHKMPVDNLALSRLAQTPDMAPKRGPGMGRGMAGSIGDFLLQYAGANPIYGPAMQRRQEIDLQRQLAEEERAFDWKDFVRKQEYERANPKPTNNDTVADYNFILDKFGPEAAERYIQQNVIDPPRIVALPNGQFATIGGGDGPSAPTAPPAAAIAELKANPGTAAQFDEIFGPGAAQRVLGGAGPSNGSPTFP